MKSLNSSARELPPGLRNKWERHAEMMTVLVLFQEAPSDEDSAVSSAPASLSPQPLNDMWVSIWIEFSIYLACNPVPTVCFKGAEKLRLYPGRRGRRNSHPPRAADTHATPLSQLSLLLHISGLKVHIARLRFIFTYLQQCYTLVLPRSLTSSHKYVLNGNCVLLEIG